MYSYLLCLLVWTKATPKLIVGISIRYQVVGNKKAILFLLVKKKSL